MLKNDSSKQYNLEDRTYTFASQCRILVRQLDKVIGNREDGIQLIRSSGSVGANYIEANESLSKKDFLMRIKICRKEARESGYWLRLISINEIESEKLKMELLLESIELTKIFSSIIKNTKV